MENATLPLKEVVEMTETASSVTEILIEEAREVGSGFNLELMDDPEWEQARGRWDWRTQVPERLFQIWDDLSLESKLIVYIHASESASDDRDWD